MKLSSKANWSLTLAALMWGITFPLIRNALMDVDPFVFVSLRFSLAAFILFLTVRTLLYKTTRPILIGSLVVGVFNAIGYLSQTIGLETVDSARAAFITGSSVILVPFLAPLFKLAKPTAIDIVCAFIGLIGLAVLADMRHLRLSAGDLWVFLSAISFSFQINYLQQLTQKLQDYRLLAFYQILFTTPLVLLLSIGHDFSAVAQPNALGGILFCAVFATSLAYYLQNKYQKFTSAPKVALIFALEPVFASVFGFIINHELPTRSTIYGGLLLLFSLILPSVISLVRESTILKAD